MADNNGDNKPTPKFTRCRTGCLRCRTRRRKCDEGKPHCRNCIEKNLVCQYGVQVTFLPKNTFTVADEELRMPRGKKRTRNHKYQFVQEDPLVTQKDTTIDISAEEESPSSPIAGSRRARSKSVSWGTTVVDGSEAGASPQEGRFESDKSDVVADNYGSDTAQVQEDDLPYDYGSPTTHASSPVVNSGFNDRDKSAVNGLLALGAGDAANGVFAVPETPIYEPIRSNIGIFSMVPGDHRRVKNTVASTLQPGPIENFAAESTGRLGCSVGILADTMTDARKLELLRHYRYQVAPWLDICDLNHPFGITAVQMASGSEQLMTALLKLSEACDTHQVSNCEKGFSPAEPRSMNWQNDSYLTFDTPEVALRLVLQELEYLVSEIPRAWRGIRNYDFKEMGTLAQHAFNTDIRSSTYWMFLRVDLSVALANDITVQIQLPLGPIPNLALLSRAEETRERVLTYSHVLLWLCAKALMVYHRQAGPELPEVPHQLLSDWLQVFEELDQWYRLRPQEFQPIVDMENEDQYPQTGSGFPMLLFANGAGAFCNQLYHTAMMLLLQCKPRTALLNLQTSALSPLWHSRRICGIALNNDGRECWDPCLLASLLVAARSMTHESQQQEILGGFEHIRTITGWGLGEYLVQLHEDWSFLNDL
ncbi:hypothetical protein BO71DRAFT_245939 [Aspergillus ellipticus CBS 707.79]|uniref:Zn(2)-C6 fungal-type domain-containing protein n=1 Tax=Aspergillus ellipticus CBS 707.79 TaxID=1448320 RepID=A0A319ES51_9EURO|nr:hypothetical protein BO71DRAFT_245939 [Aspergillus ellipticus CBS 707.79]